LDYWRRERAGGADYTPLWAGDATIKPTSIVVNCR
jgi:hypothetical protein